MSNRHFSSYYLVSPFEYEAGFQVLEEKVVETAKKEKEQPSKFTIENASMSLTFQNKHINQIFGVEREALERGVDPHTREGLLDREKFWSDAFLQVAPIPPPKPSPQSIQKPMAIVRPGLLKMSILARPAPHLTIASKPLIADKAKLPFEDKSFSPLHYENKMINQMGGDREALELGVDPRTFDDIDPVMNPKAGLRSSAVGRGSIFQSKTKKTSMGWNSV